MRTSFSYSVRNRIQYLVIYEMFLSTGVNLRLITF